MIKYDNLLIIICILCIIGEILACVIKLPNIIVYSIPIILFLVGMVMIIGIMRQSKKNKEKKKESKKETIDIL